MSAVTEGHLPSTTWQKYQDYDCPVDPKQNDRATTIKLLSLKKPHMRAFWVSTFSFFMAFVAWFSLAPLMPEVKKSLKLSKIDVNNSNIAAVSAAAFSRAMIGPLADTWGARWTTAGLMVAGSIPVYLTGLVNTANELSCLRFFIGIFGGVFVANQAWATQMFAKEIVGTANGASAGWGNLGGGVTHIFMVGVWNAFKSGGLDAEAAWRWCFLVPATICMMCAFASIFLADDSPKGNFSELVKHGAMVRKSSKKSSITGAKNYNSWLLGAQYAACFGTELVVFNIATSYFHDKFDIELEKAALIAALFGFMNVVTRAGGGLLSDTLARAFGGGTQGMRGRILAHTCCLVFEGVMLIIFSKMQSLGASIVLLVLFSLGVQMGNGSTFAIVPFVCPQATGAVSGIAGAGGNLGAIAWSLLFRFGPEDDAECFMYLGIAVLCISLTTVLIRIQGHDTLLFKAKGEPAAVDTY